MCSAALADLHLQGWGVRRNGLSCRHEAKSATESLTESLSLIYSINKSTVQHAAPPLEIYTVDPRYLEFQGTH